MNLADVLKTQASVLTDSVVDTIKSAVGLPTLPPVQQVNPYQNSNNYVESRAAPVAIQPETGGSVSNKNLIMYGAIALGVVVVVGLVLRK